jgi:hypothetical protein
MGDFEKSLKPIRERKRSGPMGDGRKAKTKKAPRPATPWARVSDFDGGAGRLREGEDAGDVIERQAQPPAQARGGAAS